MVQKYTDPWYILSLTSDLAVRRAQLLWRLSQEVLTLKGSLNNWPRHCLKIESAGDTVPCVLGLDPPVLLPQKGENNKKRAQVWYRSSGDQSIKVCSVLNIIVKINKLKWAQEKRKVQILVCVHHVTYPFWVIQGISFRSFWLHGGGQSIILTCFRCKLCCLKFALSEV